MDVVTLGETMVRFSPPLGESLESAPVLHADPGGAESNVAVALARLGLSVGWISRLPETTIGRRCAGQIRRHGVDTSRVIWATGERMGTYYIEPGRTPRPTTVVYDRADSAFSRIQPDEVDWSYVRQAGWLHLTGITPALGAGPRHVIQRAMQEAAAADITVSFDVNYRAKLWTPEEAGEGSAPFLEQTTIIQCAIHNAQLSFGTPSDGVAAAQAVYERFRPRLAVITAGEEGGSAHDGEWISRPCVPVESLLQYLSTATVG